MPADSLTAAVYSLLTIAQLSQPVRNLNYRVTLTGVDIHLELPTVR